LFVEDEFSVTVSAAGGGGGGNNPPTFEVDDMNSNTRTSDFTTNIDSNASGNGNKYFLGSIENISDPDGDGDDGGVIITCDQTPNCDPPGTVFSIPSNNRLPVGTYTTTYTVTDDANPTNSATITETIIVS